MTVADIELDMDFMAEIESLSAIPCDMSECEAEAAWQYVAKCCGHTILVCETHHEKIYPRVVNDPRPVYCEICKFLGPLREIFMYIERL